jgi:ankyrin repeat protein
LHLISGQTLALYFLVLKGVDINSVDNEGHTALHWAADQVTSDQMLF